MGRDWIRLVHHSHEAELVGLVDLSVNAATGALEREGVTGVPVSASLGELIGATSPDAILNATIPQAHHAVTTEALFAGLPVLCELAAIGEIGILSTQFFKNPALSGLRLELNHVLLVEMAIHGFDCARYLLDREPVAVRCVEFQPSWSAFAPNAAPAASAMFEFEGGVHFAYTGSLVSAGLETTWYGEWRARVVRSVPRCGTARVRRWSPPRYRPRLTCHHPRRSRARLPSSWRHCEPGSLRPAKCARTR